MVKSFIVTCKVKNKKYWFIFNKFVCFSALSFQIIFSLSWLLVYSILESSGLNQQKNLTLKKVWWGYPGLCVCARDNKLN